MYYIHPDHLGSYDMVTTDNKVVSERYHFDPWGNRKNPTNWSAADTRISFLFDRGFTGHEHLDSFKIINMNARLYDPVISRFFSPDPYVQLPEFTQAFNRYSYCLNNPLRYVDSSGMLYDWFENSLTGAIFYNSTYGKNDAGKGNMLGDGWKWIGSNDMFGKVDNNFLNDYNEYYSLGGGYAFVWTNKSVDGFLSDSYEISFGNKSEAFMSKMGYNKKPLVADIHVKENMQSVAEPHAPIWIIRIDEVTEKVHAWTYVVKGAEGNFRIIDNYDVTRRKEVAAGIIVENRYERRQYNYSKPQKSDWNKTVNFILNTGADLMRVYFNGH